MQLGATTRHVRGRSAVPIRVSLVDERITVARRDDSTWSPLFGYSIAPGRPPHLHPLNAPNTTAAMTRVSPVDHPWQHGVFTALHDVDGIDFWCGSHDLYPPEQRGSIVNRALTVRSGGDAGFVVDNAWVDPNGRDVLLERQAFEPSPPPADGTWYAVDLTWSLRAAGSTVVVGAGDYGGLAVRLVGTPDTRRHANSEGDEGDACAGKAARWVSVAQPVDGVGRFSVDAYEGFAYAYAGVAVFEHPHNPRAPNRWRVDADGMVNPALPLGGELRIVPDEPLECRYRLLAFLGPGDPEWIDHQYGEWGQT